MLFKHRTEIAAVVVPCHRRNFIYGKLPLDKKPLCLLNPFSCYVLKGSEVQTVLKNPAKILRRKTCNTGKLFKPKLLHIMLVNIFKHRFKLQKPCALIVKILKVHTSVKLKQKLIQKRRAFMTAVIIIGFKKEKNFLENRVY